MKELFGAIVILIFGIFAKGNKAVLSVSTLNDQAPTETPITSMTPSPTIKTKVTVVPTSMPTKIVSNANDDWQYPGSTKTGNGNWESHDNANKITDWYVAKIKGMGMPVTSFVKTSANEKIKNSLGAAKNNMNIKVEINQNNASESVHISVTVDNP